MTNKLKALSLGVSAAIVASGAAVAALPTGLDLKGFTVQSGVGADGAAIAFTDTICGTAGWTCSTVATDAGYAQRMVTDGTDTYIQSVVAEGGSVSGLTAAGGLDAGGSTTQAAITATFDDLLFTDSSLVLMNNGNSLAQEGRLAEVHITLEVDMTTSLRKGAFWTSTDIADGAANLVFNQIVAGEQGGAGTANTLFFSAFQFQEVATDMGAASTDAMVILRVAQLAASSATEKQQFRMSRLNNSSFNSVAPYTYYAQDSMTVANVTITSDSADAEIELLWIGQNFGSGALGIERIAGPVGDAGSKTSFGSTGFDSAGNNLNNTVIGPNNSVHTAGTPGNGFDWSNSVSGPNAIYQPKF